MLIRSATPQDESGILGALQSNAGDPSLFQQPALWLRRHMAEFLVVEDDAGELLGCAQVHVHRPDNVEILAVSVLPRAQGQSVGRMLMRKALEVAMERKPSFLWLATGKPDYFATFGFRPITKWHLPLPILIYKLRLVFHQRPARWVPAIFGRPVFMRFSGEG